jgi:subtilase family serine protease
VAIRPVPHDVVFDYELGLLYLHLHGQEHYPIPYSKPWICLIVLTNAYFECVGINTLILTSLHVSMLDHLTIHTAYRNLVTVQYHTSGSGLVGNFHYIFLLRRQTNEGFH